MKKEIHKMMDYLKIKEYTLTNHGDFQFVFPFSIVYTRKDTWRETYMPGDHLHSLDNENFKNACLTRIHFSLIGACRRMSLRKQTDLELANSGLFWCMYED